MGPVPPANAKQGLLNMEGKAPAFGFSRNPGHYAVGRDISTDHSPGSDHCSGLDMDTRHNHSPVPDPYIVAYMDRMSPAPFKKVQIVGSKMILRAAVGEMVLAGPPSGMVARTDTYIGSYGTEFTNPGSLYLAVFHDIGVCTQVAFHKAAAGTHISPRPELAFFNPGRRILAGIGRYACIFRHQENTARKM